MSDSGDILRSLPVTNTLILGGSFNPIHHGHLICAAAAAEKAGFDAVLLVPAGQPPHKPFDPAMASAEHRLAMCQEAVKSSRVSFFVWDYEAKKATPCYTVETAQKLRDSGFQRVSWLIGADMVNTLPRWHQPDALLEAVEFHVLARPGFVFDWDRLGPKYQSLRERIIPAPLIEISSTDIRQRVAAGRSIDFLTPPSVVHHISNHGLYRAATR